MEFNLWKIFTLESNQQKLPHRIEQSIFPTLKGISIKTKCGEAGYRIKGPINHKIKLLFKAVYLVVVKKNIWPLSRSHIVRRPEGCINLSCIQIINLSNVIYGLIKNSIITFFNTLSIDIFRVVYFNLEKGTLDHSVVRFSTYDPFSYQVKNC